MLNAKLKPLEPYLNAHAKWKCECLVCGSIVTPRYSTVQSKGAGCRTCRYRKIRAHHVLSISEVEEVALKRGGKLLENHYINTDTPMKFQCSKGHIFENRYSKIKQGQWCPTCNKGSKSEEIARTTFEQLFDNPFPKKRPPWLRNSRGFRMEIDGYCEKLSIGFEYQGIQHFLKDPFGNDISKRIADDELKSELCRKHGVFLFILTYEMPYEYFPKEIYAQAKEFGLKLPANFLNKKVDLDRAYIRNDRIEELKAIMKIKNIEVLSRKYLGSNQKVELRCLICGHRWKSNGNSFFNSRRTSGCDKCNRRESGVSRMLNIKELIDYANLFEGKLISTVYEGAKSKYTWQCKAGHKFVRKYSNMKFRKQFCPYCK